jgi:hypothetical protein
MARRTTQGEPTGEREPREGGGGGGGGGIGGCAVSGRSGRSGTERARVCARARACASRVLQAVKKKLHSQAEQLRAGKLGHGPRAPVGIKSNAVHKRGGMALEVRARARAPSCSHACRKTVFLFDFSFFHYKTVSILFSKFCFRNNYSV